MLCNMKITHPIQEVSDITAFEMRCEMAAEKASVVSSVRPVKIMFHISSISSTGRTQKVMNA